MSISGKVKRQANIDTSDTVPYTYYTDDIYFYEIPSSQYFLFSCDNSSKKLANQTNEVVVRSKADLEKLSSLKCERNNRLQFLLIVHLRF